MADDDDVPLLVCSPVSYFLDDVHGACTNCGTAIVWRPDAPAEAVRLCVRCAAAVVAGADDVSVEVTPETAREHARFPFGTRPGPGTTAVDGAREPEATATTSIHLVTYASQPDVQIVCTQVWTQPAWKDTTVSPGVFRADNGAVYTFTRSLATCPECLRGRSGANDDA